MWTSIYGNRYVVKDVVVLAVTDCHTIHIWGKYPPLATHSEGNDSFLLYQASSIKCPQKLTEESWHKCAVVQEMSHDLSVHQLEKGIHVWCAWWNY